MYRSQPGIRTREGGIRAGLILTEANWAPWYGKMKAGLLVNGVLDIVDGTRVRPGPLPAAIPGTGDVVMNQAAIDTMKKAAADWDKEAAKAASLTV